MRVDLKRLMLLGLILAVLACVRPAGPPREAWRDPLTPKQRAYIQVHGPIRYAPDPQFPPFEALAPAQKAEGITPDILALMARHLRITFATVPCSSWSDCLQAVREGRADVLGTICKNEEREEYLAFTRPYFDMPYVLFAHSGEPDYEDFKRLAGRRVGVVKDYSSQLWLQQHHPEVIVVPERNTEAGMADLATGHLSAMLESLPVGLWVLRSNATINVEVSSPVLFGEPQYLAVRKGDAVLLEILGKGLDGISPADKGGVFARWVGVDFSRPQRHLSPLMKSMVWGLLAGVLVVILWNLFLRRKVASQTRALQASERHYRALFDNAGDAILLFDPNNEVILEANPAACVLYGFSREELLGKSLKSLTADVPRGESQIQSLRSDGSFRNFETVHFKKDGTPMTILASASFMEFQGRRAVLSLHREVTELKRVEAQRLRMQEELERARALEKVGALVQGLAHEVRNPLFAITANAAAMEKVAKLEEGTAPFIANIGEHVRRLDRLMRDLLELGQPTGEREMVRGDLGETVAEACAMAGELAQSAEATIHYEIPAAPVVARYSRQKILLAIAHVATNALQASPPGGRVRVRCVREAGACTISVSDEGPGIPADILPKVFDPFMTTKAHQSGLGLTLAKHYVESHGGAMTAANNDPPPGATFTFRLPIAESEWPP